MSLSFTGSFSNPIQESQYIQFTTKVKGDTLLYSQPHSLLSLSSFYTLLLCPRKSTNSATSDLEETSVNHAKKEKI